MISFERAAELGVDVLETDVHLSADGHVMVSHDADGLRAARVARSIRTCTLAELRGWDAGRAFVDGHGRTPFAGRGHSIPTLAEVLERFPRMALNIDIKQRRPSMI